MQQKCPLALALAPKLGSRSRYLTGKLAKAETKAAPPMADTSGAAKPSAAFLVRVRVRVRASDQPNPNPNPNQHPKTAPDRYSLYTHTCSADRRPGPTMPSPTRRN